MTPKQKEGAGPLTQNRPQKEPTDAIVAQETMVVNPAQSTELIVIRQLPEIEEHLLTIKAQIQEKVSEALSLACTEETVKTVKAVRAELNRDFDELETKRKEVKRAILAPYEAFEAVYEDCVTSVFRPAIGQLTSKINEVENGIKEAMRSEVKTFFTEYAQSKGIDFVDFARAGIDVKLTSSRKALIDQSRAILDKIAEELMLIESQDHKEEILVEYKKTLNVAQAITAVKERVKAVEAERARAEEAKRAAEERAASVTKVEAVIAEQTALTAPAAAPAPEEIPLPWDVPGEPESDQLYEVVFSVTDTIARLNALKQFLKEGGYTYVNQ
jgi:hypothetical protein